MERKFVRKDEQIKLIMECRQSGLSDYWSYVKKKYKLNMNFLPQYSLLLCYIDFQMP